MLVGRCFDVFTFGCICGLVVLGSIARYLVSAGSTVFSWSALFLAISFRLSLRFIYGGRNFSVFRFGCAFVLFVVGAISRFFSSAVSSVYLWWAQFLGISFRLLLRLINGPRNFSLFLSFLLFDLFLFSSISCFFISDVLTSEGLPL